MPLGKDRVPSAKQYTGMSSFTSPAARLRLYQSISNGVAHQSGGLMNIEFFHYFRAVRIGRLDADAEQCRDLLGRMPFANHLQHLSFTHPQFPVARLGVGQIRMYHPLADLWT